MYVWLYLSVFLRLIPLLIFENNFFVYTVKKETGNMNEGNGGHCGHIVCTLILRTKRFNPFNLVIKGF